MSFIKYLLVDCIVGTQVEGDGLLVCAAAGWLGAVRAESWLDVKSM